MGETPIFLLLLLESFNETGVAMKFQLFSCKDGAGRLRPSYFIVRVVVLVFKLPEFLWIAEKN